MLVIKFRNSEDHKHLLKKIKKMREEIEDVEDIIKDCVEDESDVDYRHDDERGYDDRRDHRSEYITHDGVRYRRMR